MDWIKKNSEKFSLPALSVALLGAAAYLAYTAHDFLAAFDSLKKPVPEFYTPIPLERASLDAAQASLEKPAAWTSHYPLLVSQPVIVGDDGIPQLMDDTRKDLHPPVPNDWLKKYHLDLLDQDILNEDPDDDGFTNLEEWKAGTDPTDPNSHPPYTTKLLLEKFIQVPFRLEFKGRPDDKTFQIDTIDVRQPTQILSMGDAIANTKFKIVDFKEKHHQDANGIDVDDSELTIQNTETNAKIVLVLEQIVNDPDSYALFKYLWKGTAEIKVKKDGTFSLKPETDIQYKVIDISDTGATIQNLKTNETIKIPHL